MVPAAGMTYACINVTKDNSTPIRPSFHPCSVTESPRMKAIQSNKLKRLQTLDGVLEAHEDTWNVLPAFVRARNELGAVIPQITGTVQVQLSAPDAAGEKRLARETLGDTATEIAAAVLAYAEENDDTELAGRVDFSRTDIIKGRDSTVVARCRDIHAAATENLAELADAGITAAKLTAFKKQIDGFENLQTKPRQNLAKRSAATRLMPTLLRKADRIVGRRMNKLVVQFKTTAPDFYNAYQTAVSIVNSGSGHSTNSNGNGGTPAPKPA